MKNILVSLILVLAACTTLAAKTPFVQVENGHFVRNGKPYYYVGTNFWYGAILASEGQGGYYKYVFSLVADNAETGGYFAGCNFWGWGGFAQPKHEQWQVGDDYTGDPAQEAQGLNSVFASDTSTLKVVTEQVDRMKRVK